MWIFMSDSALSIVKFEGDSALGDVLLVRSRNKGDIEKFIDLGVSDKALGAKRTLEVFSIESADYRWRLMAPRWLVNECIAQYVANIDYPNFKNSVTDKRRKFAYTDVWNAMFQDYGGYGQEGRDALLGYGLNHGLDEEDFKDEDGEWLV